MTRFAYCHFCDDIRLEVGHKITLVGMYSGQLLVPTFPAILPKLCIVAFCASPIETPLKSLIIRAKMNELVLQEITLGEADLQQAFQTIEGSDSNSDCDEPFQLFQIGAHIVISPFIADCCTTLTVMVNADGEEMMAGKLRIRQGEIPQQNAP